MKKKKNNTKKRFWKYTKTLIMTPLMSLKKFRQDKFNDIKKYYY